MAVATRNAPKSETLTATLANERRAMREQARAEIIRLYLAGEPLSADLLDLFDALNLHGLEREKFIGQSQQIAALQRQAGSRAEREAAHRRLADAEAARDDEKAGVEALQREIAALNARLVGLERAAAQASAEITRREKAVEDLRSIVENDEFAGRDYRAAMRRLSFPDLALRVRVRELEALLEERDPHVKVAHVSALARHEREDLREWGARMNSHRPNDNRNIEIVHWDSYVAARREELAEILPRAELAEAEHARAIEKLRADLLSAHVPG